MAKANEILEFYFNSANFKVNIDNILAPLSNIINSRVGRLKTITQAAGESQFTFKGGNTIPLVFRRFKALFKSDKSEINKFEIRELRTLTYAIYYSENKVPSIFSIAEELEYLLQILEQKWRDLYLLGLAEGFLRNWEAENTKQSKLLSEFITKKLREYNGSKTVLSALKRNVRFFDSQNGDLLLGNELAIMNCPIKEAPKFLSLPEKWFTYHYFSRVILAYYEKRKNNLRGYLDELNEALIANNYSVTNKRLISRMIIQCNSQNHLDLQDKVKVMAFRILKDPAMSGNWAPFERATESEITELKQARIILNEWITRQFISVFFEKCINDPRRKRFWLKVTEQISSFKVFGSRDIYHQLKLDKRITEFVDYRFQITTGSKQVAAFFMHVRNYKLIEFSDPGFAFYAYKSSNPKSPSMDSMYNSVESFRNGNLPMLVYRSGYELHGFSDEGRLSHSDGDLTWEEVFSKWLKKTVGIDV